jgi:hypothetical protein
MDAATTWLQQHGCHIHAAVGRAQSLEVAVEVERAGEFGVRLEWHRILSDALLLEQEDRVVRSVPRPGQPLAAAACSLAIAFSAASAPTQKGAQLPRKTAFDIRQLTDVLH